MEILELQSTITKRKNSLEGHNYTLQLTKERINELDNKSVEITQEHKKEWRKINRALEKYGTLLSAPIRS